MSDKSLRFMDKTQLLNIMRQQELEIDRLSAEVEKLVSGKDEQIENLTYGSERLLSEKDAEINKLNEELEKLAAEKTGNTEVIAMELEKLSAEKGELVNRLNADILKLNTDILKLKAENEALASENEQLTEVQDNNGQIEGLLSEKDDQIERLNARIIRLTFEKDEQGKEMEKLSAENDEQLEQIEKLTEEKDELIKNSLAAAIKEKEQPQLSLENTGSLAEASISVAGVMLAAQEAADVYLQNIKLLEAEKAAAAEKMVEEAKDRAGAIIKTAEARCRELEEAEKKALGDLQSVSFLYMDFIDKSHSALHEMIDRYKLTKLTQNDETGYTAKNQ